MSGLNLTGSGLTLVDPVAVTAAVANSIVNNVTSITGGTTGSLVYDNAGKVGEILMGAGVQAALAVAVGATNGFVTATVPVASGGTGATSGVGAMMALSGVYIVGLSGTSATTTAATEGTGIQIAVNLGANALSANGVLEVDLQLDTKALTSAASVIVRYAVGSGVGTSGTTLISTSLAANLTLLMHLRMFNAGATNAQLFTGTGLPYATTTNAMTPAAIDSTTATVFRINVFAATGGGTAVVRGYQAKLLSNSGT